MERIILALGACLLGLALVLVPSASASVIDPLSDSNFLTAKVGANQTVLLGSETAGVLFTNLSQADGFVAIEFIGGASSDPVLGGFQLLDGTLRISSNIPDGEKRVRVRMGYSEERILRAGLRAGSQRLFRRVGASSGRARWDRAIRAIRGRATGRRFARSAPVRGLGNHGFDAQNGFVWAFLDVTSDYAVGARRVAEPASLFLMASGLGLVLWSRRKGA